MSDTAKSNRLPADPNLLGLVLVVLTIIGANFTSASMTANSIRNEMGARFDVIDQRFDAVDQRFDAVDQRFETIESRLRGVDEELVRINGRLYDLNQRLSRVETGVFGYEPPAIPDSPPADDAAPTPEAEPEPDPGRVADL